jgi:septum site-determining protein MinC
MNKVIDLKGSILSLSILKIHSSDIEITQQAIEDKISQAPEFFVDIPIILEPQIEDIEADFLAELVAFLNEKMMIPIGIRTRNESIKEHAIKIGLAVFKDESSLRKRSKPVKEPGTPEDKATEVVAEVGLKTAMVIKSAVRSGQQVYAKDRDLIILGSVNAGSEVIADGSVHVYGAVRGKVFAGSQGEMSSQIFAQKLDPELVCIAGVYQLSDDIPHEFKQGFINVNFLNDKLNFRVL